MSYGVRPLPSAAIHGHRDPAQARESQKTLIIDTVTAVALSVFSFISADALDRSSPVAASFLRFAPVLIGIAWLLRRISPKDSREDSRSFPLPRSHVGHNPPSFWRRVFFRLAPSRFHHAPPPSYRPTGGVTPYGDVDPGLVSLSRTPPRGTYVQTSLRAPHLELRPVTPLPTAPPYEYSLGHQMGATSVTAARPVPITTHAPTAPTIFGHSSPVSGPLPTSAHRSAPIDHSLRSLPSGGFSSQPPGLGLGTHATGGLLSMSASGHAPPPPPPYSARPATVGFSSSSGLRHSSHVPGGPLPTSAPRSAPSHDSSRSGSSGGALRTIGNGSGGPTVPLGDKR